MSIHGTGTHQNYNWNWQQQGPQQQTSEGSTDPDTSATAAARFEDLPAGHSAHGDDHGSGHGDGGGGLQVLGLDAHLVVRVRLEARQTVPVLRGVPGYKD